MDMESRTEYSAKNTSIGMISKIITIIMGYLTRIVFIRTLNEDYVGVNGLFTDILYVLSLSELGLSTAISYALYRPIADNDFEKIKSLMLLYKKMYRVVACIVAAFGLMIIPFLDILIKNQPQVDHLIFIYLLYLGNSVVSYLLVYKRTILDANQLSYVGTLFQTLFYLLQYCLQIFVLVRTHNFILYLLIFILCTIGCNVCISKKADRMYPYIRGKNVQMLEDKEKKEIWKNIRAMLLHKIGDVAVNNTDNLILSAFVGTMAVGRYSNYFLIIGSIRQIFDQAFRGITASVGNLGVRENEAHVRKVFESTFFVGQWFYGLAAVCLYELLNPFVELSFGANFLFGREIVLVLCVNFFVRGMCMSTVVFRDSLGLFWKDRYKSVAEALINLAVSIILVKQLGVQGVFLGTFISTMATTFWVEPWVLYRYLKSSPVTYFIRSVGYAAAWFGVWLVTDLVCDKVHGGLVAVLVIRLCICAVLCNGLMWLIYHKTEEYSYLLSKLRKLWGRLLVKAGITSDIAQRAKNSSAVFSQVTPAMKGLCMYLGESLHGVYDSTKASGILKETADIEDNVMDELCALADAHAVLPLIYDGMIRQDSLSEEVKLRMTRKTRQVVNQSYRLLFLSKYIVGLLEEENIDVIVIKGPATAEYYPIPELRKSGDVDLVFFSWEDVERSVEILAAHGFVEKERQTANHHIVVENAEHIDIELHGMLAEPFDNERVNQMLADLLKQSRSHIIRQDCMGVELPVLAGAYHGLELLLHCLQHFLRAGFGIKLLCDWVVFWENTPMEEQEPFLDMCAALQVQGFVSAITGVCVKYLGMSETLAKRLLEAGNPNTQDDVYLCKLLVEILQAEEFGKSSGDRMVAMRGDHLKDYVREFHHQMQLNYPRAGRIIVLWPVLWCMTLAVFLYNNSIHRHISTKEILRTAGNRGRMVEIMKIFKQK